MLRDDGLVECELCGATFPNTEDGITDYWSHCCHIDEDED